MAVYLQTNGGTRTAPNLTRLLHDPIAHLPNQAIESIKHEIDRLLVESKDKNTNPFSCSHNDGDEFSSSSSKGCN